MRLNLALHSPSLIYWGGYGPKKNVKHIIIAGSSHIYYIPKRVCFGSPYIIVQNLWNTGLACGFLD